MKYKPVLDHIAIVTLDLEQTLEFYEKNLGLKCTHRETLEARGIRVAFLPIGDSNIELIEPLHEQSEISSFLAKKGPGIHHIAITAHGLDETIKELNGAGIKTTSDKPTPGAHNTQVCFIHPKSTSGVLIELVEHQ